MTPARVRLLALTSVLLGLGINPAAAKQPDPPSPPAAAASVAPSTTQETVAQALRRYRVDRSASRALDVAKQTLDLAEAGEARHAGVPTLVWASRFLTEGFRKVEATSTAGAPDRYYAPLYGLVNRLMRAARLSTEPATAAAVEVAVLQLVDRLETAQSGASVEGYDGRTFHHDAERARELVELAPGKVAFWSNAWSAAWILDRAGKTFAPDATGPEDALRHARAALRASGEEAARSGEDPGPAACRAHRGMARYWAVAMANDATPDRVGASVHLERHALKTGQCGDLGQDAQVADWIELAARTRLEIFSEEGRIPELVGHLERLVQAPFTETAWTHRPAVVLDFVVRDLWQLLEAQAATLRPIDGFDQFVTRAQVLAEQAFREVYETPPVRLDSETRDHVDQVLALLAQLADNVGDYELEAEAEALRARLPAASEQAAMAPQAAGVARTVPWTGPTERLLRDIRLAAEHAHDAALPRDGRARRYSNRQWILRGIEDLVLELERRAAMPGTLGQAARDAHARGLQWLGLAHYASANPEGGALVLEQARLLESNAPHLPLDELGQNASELLPSWKGDRGVEVRPLLLRVPKGCPELAVRGGESHGDVLSVTQLDLDLRSGGWTRPSTPPGEHWVFTVVPADQDLTLIVGDLSRELPPGGDVISRRLELSEHGVHLVQIPPPGPGTPREY